MKKSNNKLNKKRNQKILKLVGMKLEKNPAFTNKINHKEQ